MAIPTFICIVGLLAIIIYRKKLFHKRKLFWISISVFLILYALIVGTATYNDIYYQWNLNRYDLDKDSFFSGKEITPAQIEAMKKLTNDVGRNLSFITGFIFALIVSTVVYIFGLIISKLKNNGKKEKPQATNGFASGGVNGFD